MPTLHVYSGETVDVTFKPIRVHRSHITERADYGEIVNLLAKEFPFSKTITVGIEDGVSFARVTVCLSDRNTVELVKQTEDRLRELVIYVPDPLDDMTYCSQCAAECKHWKKS